MITPAITVMGAIEGLHIATPFFDPYVVPLAVVILVGIFLLQSRGTTAVGAVFGPVTTVWFAVLSVLGISQIVRARAVLAAVNPVHALQLFLQNGWHGFVVLGGVSGGNRGEALYADIGHFGTAGSADVVFCGGASRIAAELLWARRPPARRSGRSGKPVLPHGSGLALYPFFGANMVKIAQGGWFPLLVSAIVLFLMLTWRKGRKVLGALMKEMTVPLDVFLEDLRRNRIQRVKGTAVFMSGSRTGTPLALLHNLKHNKVLHEHVIVLTVTTEQVPYVDDPARRARSRDCMRASGAQSCTMASWRNRICPPRWQP